MNSFLYFLLAFELCLSVVNGGSGATTYYEAVLKSSETGGASGIFDMTLQNGEIGYYKWNINLNQFSIPQKLIDGGCNADYIAKKGLKYHIHTSWDDSSPTLSSVYTGCNQCAGHYDPFLACSERSISHGTLCSSLRRTLTLGYTYNCNSTVYTAGHLAKCEVGDLSGKFGLMQIVNPTNLQNLTFIGSVYGDYNPPIATNYLKSDALSSAWTSLVLHCPIVNASAGLSTPAILCAKLVRVNPSPVPALPVATDASVKRSGEISGFFNASFATSGAQGTFSLLVDGNGMGSYYWSISLAGLTTLSASDIAQIQTYGIKYHIHANWNDTLGHATTTCGGAGGHYDPYLTCSSKSQNQATLCPLINRTSAHGYAYGVNCNASSFGLGQQGHLSLCEVGDLSGKNGFIPPSSNMMFTGSFIGDPHPPLVANYRCPDLVSGQWASVVLHLPLAPSPAFLCARLVANAESAFHAPTGSPVAVSASKALSAGAVAGIVIFVLIAAGLIVMALLVYFGIITDSSLNINGFAKQSQKPNFKPQEWNWNISTDSSASKELPLSAGSPSVSRVSFGLKGTNETL